MLWLSIRVDLVDGAPAPALWPRPGRVLIARPDMTFLMLADAIETAFARFGPPPHHEFTFSDGTRIARGDDTQHLVRLEYGERFAYEQQPGDGWSHLCTVGPTPTDPLAAFGTRPDRPVVVDGWGVLPDPTGREWEDDDGATPVAARPSPPLSDLPALLPWWGTGARWLAAPFSTGPAGRGTDEAAEHGRHPLDDVDAGPWDEPWDDVGLAGLRAAIEEHDLISIVALFAEYDEIDVLHLAGSTLSGAAAAGDRTAREALLPLLDVLDERDWPGDRELADEFRIALARGAGSIPRPRASSTAAPAPHELRPTPVDLATLAAVLDGPDDPAFTWTLEIPTGRLIAPTAPDATAPEATADGDTGLPEDDVAIVDRVPIVGSGARRQLDDLLAFVDLESDPDAEGVIASAPRALWTRIEEDLLRDPDQYHQWTLFAQERRLGRARRWLTDHDLRPLMPWDRADDAR